MDAVAIWIRSVAQSNGLQIDTAVKYLLKHHGTHGSVNELRDWSDSNVISLIEVNTNALIM